MHSAAAVAVATALLDKVAAVDEEEAAPRGGEGGGTRPSGTTARHHPQHAAGGRGRRGKKNTIRLISPGREDCGAGTRFTVREDNGTVHSVLLLTVRPSGDTSRMGLQDIRDYYTRARADSRHCLRLARFQEVLPELGETCNSNFKHIEISNLKNEITLNFY